MKVRKFHIPKYDWHVTVFFAVTCYHSSDILASLSAIDCPDNLLERVADNLEKRQMDTGVTYSNRKRRCSVVVVGLSSSAAEFLNSFEHELRHLVDDIASVSQIAFTGEDVAYLTGEINLELWGDLHDFICSKCRKSHENR